MRRVGGVSAPWAALSGSHVSGGVCPEGGWVADSTLSLTTSGITWHWARMGRANETPVLLAERLWP